MTITATELKKNLGKYLDMAIEEDGIITKNGHAIAKLSNPFMDKMEMATSLFGILEGNEMTLEDAKKERLSKNE